MFEKQVPKGQRLVVPRGEPALHVHAGAFKMNSPMVDFVGRTNATHLRYATFYKEGDLIALRLSASNNGEGVIKGSLGSGSGRHASVPTFSSTALCRMWGIPLAEKVKGVKTHGLTFRFPYVKTITIDGEKAYVFRMELNSEEVRE